MIRFIHTADIHFGVENYGKIDPVTGVHTRLLDFHRALSFCVDTAINEQVDFFLFAGDAYKTAHPSPTQQRMLTECLLRLHKANIPIIIVVGNHDNPLSFGKAHSLDIFGQLPVDGFHVIAKPTTLTLQTKQGPVNIVGIPWPTRNSIAVARKHAYKSAHEITTYIADAVAKIITHHASQLDPTIPAVLTGHLTVSSGIFSGSEKRAIYGTDPVLMPSQLAIAPFDYVALGHLHRYQNLNANGHPAVVYAGSIERVDFGERKEDKGFCLVTVHDKQNTSHVFIKTPQRPFIQVEVHLKTDEPQTDQIIHALQQHDLRDAVVKIVYHIPQSKQDTVDLKLVQQACQQAHFVVGIIPVHKPTQREHRAAMKIEMDLMTLLDRYISLKPELTDRKASLMSKALQMEQDVLASDDHELET
jgi:exonuclease SbcD